MSHQDPERGESPVNVRQGFLGRPVLYVLLAGLLLAAIIIIAVVIWAGDEEEPPLDPPGADEEITPENRL